MLIDSDDERLTRPERNYLRAIAGADGHSFTALIFITANLVTMKLIVLTMVLLATSPALAENPTIAESICVKYGPCPLDVSVFTCVDTPRSSFIRRVCYDEPKAFMVIKLNETWYPYCEIDAVTVQQLIAAESAGKFYNQNIRSRPDGSHGPFDCRDHPIPKYATPD